MAIRIYSSFSIKDSIEDIAIYLVDERSTYILNLETFTFSKFSFSIYPTQNISQNSVGYSEIRYLKKVTDINEFALYLKQSLIKEKDLQVIKLVNALGEPDAKNI